MAEHEMLKTSLMGGYDKEEVQELIQKMKDEMAEAQVNFRKQIADRDEKIAELQKRIDLRMLIRRAWKRTLKKNIRSILIIMKVLENWFSMHN